MSIQAEPKTSCCFAVRIGADLLGSFTAVSGISHEIEMETFQEAFYKEGLDVLSLADEAKVAARWGIGEKELEDMLRSDKVRETASRDMAEAEDILGDFVVYPSLFVRTDDGTLHAVARGYAPFEEVEAKIEDALGRGASLDTVSADACGLDGSCCR